MLPTNTVAANKANMERFIIARFLSRLWSHGRLAPRVAVRAIELKPPSNEAARLLTVCENGMRDPGETSPTGTIGRATSKVQQIVILGTCGNFGAIAPVATLDKLARRAAGTVPKSCGLRGASAAADSLAKAGNRPG